ncbi:hypothetical protein VNO77_34452 [Canavalia gladiata]|uniref:Uncharacterized protein n=1 Tax=Canavalia gladiata TaxID=3824 RepID=A0AAN9KE95_CANGL
MNMVANVSFEQLAAWKTTQAKKPVEEPLLLKLYVKKNKKVKSLRLSFDSKDSASSSELGCLKFLHALSCFMDFHLGGLPFPTMLHPHPPTPNISLYNQFSSFGESSSASSFFNLDPSVCTSNSLATINYTLYYSSAIHGKSSMNVHTTFSSSIESFSSIN